MKNWWVRGLFFSLLALYTLGTRPQQYNEVDSHQNFKQPQKRYAVGDTLSFCGDGDCNFGVCVNGDNCNCDSQVRGEYCDTKLLPCNVSDPCQNMGECFLDELDVFCRCPYEYTGSRCQYLRVLSSATGQLNEFTLTREGSCNRGGFCEPNGNCRTTGPDEHICLCQNGFIGASCTINADDICGANICQNGGLCRSSSVGTFTCDCSVVPFTGRFCEQPSDSPVCGRLTRPCINGQCIEEGGQQYSCVCNSGWTGPRCDIDANECCRDNPCNSFQTCKNTLGSYECLYSGSPEARLYTDCYRGSPPSFLGTGNPAPTYSPPILSELPPFCDPNPCKNGGTCVHLRRSYLCRCTMEYTGETCEERVNPCFRTDIDGCENGGRCTFEAGLYLVCDCSEISYTGTRCETRVYDDQCTPVNPCQNGGTCMERGMGRFECACTSQWLGSDCSINYNECTSEQPCENGGRCTNTDQGYTCDCEGTVYIGPQCTIYRNVCTLSSCKNGGTCIEVGEGQFTCTCAAGWEGEDCRRDTNECALSSGNCRNGGTCVNNPGSYSCRCDSEYGGIFCGTRIYEQACLTQRCRNGGSCIDRERGQFTCVCPLGWTSDDCSVDRDECTQQGQARCANNGICVNTPGSWRCDCDETPFKGNYCDERRNVCQPQTCQNGGTCVEELGPDYGVSCTCAPGWRGETCQISTLPPIQTDSCKITKVPGGAFSAASVSVRLVDCQKQDQIYHVVDAVKAALNGQDNYLVEDIVISASSDEYHQRFSLSSPRPEPGVFRGLHRISLDGITLENVTESEIFATANYPYDSIVLKNLAFGYPEEDGPGNILGVPSYPIGTATPSTLEISNLQSIQSVDTLLRRFEDMPIVVRLNYLEIEAVEAFRWTNEPMTEVIDLSYNRIESLEFIQDIFDKLDGSRSLKRLILKGNLIKTILAGTFRPYPDTLELVDLSGNQIASVDVCAFPWYKLIRTKLRIPRRINLDGNQLRCSECTVNYWMYRAFYEDGGQYRWRASLTSNVTCKRTRIPVSEYFRTIPVCTREIPCYGGREVTFGKSGGVLVSLYEWIIGLGGSLVGVAVIVAICCYCLCKECVCAKPQEEEEPAYGTYGFVPQPQPGDIYHDAMSAMGTPAPGMVPSTLATPTQGLNPSTMPTPRPGVWAASPRTATYGANEYGSQPEYQQPLEFHKSQRESQEFYDAPAVANRKSYLEPVAKLSDIMERGT